VTCAKHITNNVVTLGMKSFSTHIYVLKQTA